MNNINSMDDDLNTPLTWAGQANSAGSGSSLPTGGSIAGSGNVANGSGISPGNVNYQGGLAPGSNIWNGIAAALNFTLAPMPTKDDVAYVIVLNDNSCLELEEQQRLTGRELLGLSKFFNIVGAAQHVKIDVKWSELIVNLGIERHFVAGLADHMHYDTDCKTFFIFLIDSK